MRCTLRRIEDAVCDKKLKEPQNDATVLVGHTSSFTPSDGNNNSLKRKQVMLQTDEHSRKGVMNLEDDDLDGNMNGCVTNDKLQLPTAWTQTKVSSSKVGNVPQVVVCTNAIKRTGTTRVDATVSMCFVTYLHNDIFCLTISVKSYIYIYIYHMVRGKPVGLIASLALGRNYSKHHPPHYQVNNLHVSFSNC